MFSSWNAGINIKRGLAIRLTLFVSVAALAGFGLWLFGQSDQYRFWSSQNLHDVLEAKAAALFVLLLAIWTLYQLREKSYVPALSVFFVSLYFVLLYGLMFQGTQFGMNAHWADNANRISVINKILTFGDPFQDWFTKDMTMFYPPLWFWLMALMAKILQIEAFQTIKYGYLLTFLAYPWALYFAWRSVVSGKLAASMAVTTIFFTHWFIEYIPYEHISAALFLPWWLRFIARARTDDPIRHSRISFYALGIAFGSALFLTYYWWFFLGIIGLALELFGSRSEPRNKRELLHQRAIIASGILVISSVYWLPLTVSVAQNGFESTQGIFFGMRHSNLTAQWEFLNWRGFAYLAGIISAGYFFFDDKMGKLRFIYLGGLIVILLDRTLNLFDQSIQSRKLLEFAPVLLVPPLVMAATAIWEYTRERKQLRNALFGFIVIASLITYNQHTLMHEDAKFKAAIETRQPTEALRILRDVDAAGKVLLTNRYVEMCYVPFYTFIPITNTTAHPAGRYRDRERFLSSASKILEPDLLAYALTNNTYESIDFVYLPEERETGVSYLTLSQYSFVVPKKTVTYSFSVILKDHPRWFVPSPGAGLYSIAKTATLSGAAESRSRSLEKYPEIAPHLLP